MSSKAPTKLMIVRNEAKAAELRKVMGADWMVVGYMNALTGRRFDLILLVDQPERENPEKWLTYIETRVKTKLSVPGGKLIEVY